jgi:hypothetical protein
LPHPAIDASEHVSAPTIVTTLQTIALDALARILHA